MLESILLPTGRIAVEIDDDGPPEFDPRIEVWVWNVGLTCTVHSLEVTAAERLRDALTVAIETTKAADFSWARQAE